MAHYRFSKLIPKRWKVYIFNIARKILEESADHEEDEEDDDDIVDDFEDDEDDTLENIANEAAAFAPSCEEADDYDDDCDDWDIDEFMQEDIYFMTPLDEVDAYVRFSETMGHLTASGLGPELECRLSAEQRTLLSSCLDHAKSFKHSR